MTTQTPFQRMSKQEKLSRDARLSKYHERYRDYNQRRSESSEFLANKGHPMGRLYRAAANHFFALHYCNNASSRLMASNGDGSEQVSMGLPVLKERWHGYVLIKGEPFYGIYPSHPDYKKTIEAFAAAGFPNPTASAGCLFTVITVKTNSSAVIDALYQYQSENPEILIHKNNNTYDITLNGLKNKYPAARVLRGLLSLIKALYKPYWLKKATSDNDEHELVLAERPMRLGNVKSVTIRPLTVLFPLIAMGDTEHQLKVVNQVVDLLADGYPLHEGVEDYLSKLITPKAMNDLKKRFKHSSAA